ncbi:MAG: four helix bundle protein [Nitrospira sp.]|nr:four helix bundle protein [Nitrospira sp.]
MLKYYSNLEERLVVFAVSIIRIAETLPETKTGRHISGQLIRSGTSPAPNYGEAQDAESRADFIHKMKISLKELRETKVWLQMIVKAALVNPSSLVNPIIKEAEELIAIFVASVKTAKKNLKRN